MIKKEIIYLDHAAATPVDKHVLTVMLPYFSEKFYNPSSPYNLAVEVRREYESAKHTIAQLIGAQSADLVMTAGATESINLAFGVDKGHVVTSNIEHQSVLACTSNRPHTLVKADSDGMISEQEVKKAIQPKTTLVSITLANNELGTIQPIRSIASVVEAERLKRLKKGDKTPIYFHTDASQGAGQLDINVARLGIDMLTLNASKIYGPKQTGLLWVSSKVRLQPQILGGGQERGLRSGTENVASVVGFAEALKLSSSRRSHETKRLGELRDKLQADLQKAFPEMIISGQTKHKLSNFLHVSFPKIDGERLVFLLENRGVMVATGSACAANQGLRSHVLEAIGLKPEVADGSIRISLGKLSNSANIARASKIIRDVVTSEYKRIQK